MFKALLVAVIEGQVRVSLGSQVCVGRTDECSVEEVEIVKFCPVASALDVRGVAKESHLLLILQYHIYRYPCTCVSIHGPHPFLCWSEVLFPQLSLGSEFSILEPSLCTGIRGDDLVGIWVLILCACILLNSAFHHFQYQQWKAYMESCNSLKLLPKSEPSKSGKCQNESCEYCFLTWISFQSNTYTILSKIFERAW